MSKVISSLDLSNPVDVSFLKNLSAASARVSAKNTKSELRDTGLVSILTSQTRCLGIFTKSHVTFAV